MFNDKSRPLYFLCEVMRLDRISKEYLIDFVKNASQKKWGSQLTDEAINTIIALSQRHTFYFNRLCRVAFKESTPPTNNQILDFWNRYIEVQLWIEKDLALLSINQMKFLLAITKQTTVQKHGHYMRNETGMSPSSIDNVIKTLTSKDIVFINSNSEYQILDPAVYYYLKR